MWFMKIVLCSDFKLCRKCIPSNVPKWKRRLCRRGELLITLMRKARCNTYKYYVCYLKGLVPRAARDFIRSGFVSGAIYCFLLEIVVALELPAEGLACSRQPRSPSCPCLASKPPCSWERAAFPRQGMDTGLASQCCLRVG